MSTANSSADFQTLVAAHQAIVIRVCASYCSDREDREDLAQEILVQLWRSFPRFDRTQNFATWMYRVAINVALSHVRQQYRQPRRHSGGEEQLLQLSDERQHESVEMQMLRAFIERLDGLNRALILLYLDGYQQKEIAEVLGITETNVATKINRLKERMKSELNDTNEGSKHE